MKGVLSKVKRGLSRLCWFVMTRKSMIGLYLLLAPSRNGRWKEAYIQLNRRMYQRLGSFLGEYIINTVFEDCVRYIQTNGKTIKDAMPLYTHEYLALDFQRNIETRIALWYHSYFYYLLEEVSGHRKVMREQAFFKLDEKKDVTHILMLAHNWNFSAYLINYFMHSKAHTLRTFHGDFIEKKSLSELISQGESETHPALAELISNANVIFLEWCQYVAIWGSYQLPPSKKVILRLHSYEAFSPASYMLNFGGIDGIIFVAEHIQAFFNVQHKPLMSHIKQVVIPNFTDFTQYVMGTNTNRKKVLSMAGYANKNKNPMMALDILYILLQDDTEWTLKLLGEPWQDDTSLSIDEVKYKNVFFAKMNAYQLNNHVHFAPFFCDVNAFFKEVGYVLSCSLREGTHEVILEGIASGCIPIIRNWPVCKHYDGAYNAYASFEPFIFDTPKEAASLIQATQNDFDNTVVSNKEILMQRYDARVTMPKLECFIDEVLYAETSKKHKEMLGHA